MPTRSRPLPSEEPEVDFAALGLIEPLLRAVRKAGYEKATPIQASAIPHALDGRDVLGAAQTGTGKTAAFALPLLQHLSLQERPRGGLRPVRALILSPTRELASQIEDCIAKYGAAVDVRHTVIFGGVSASNQVRELKLGIDVLVATPGRLWDLLSQRLLDLSQVEILVLDEVDRMLDQGFWPTVRKIVAKVPKKRQTLAFSATMPDALKPLISELLIDPVRVSVAKVSSAPDEIDQRVHFVPDPTHKRALLADLISDEPVERVIVFTKTKHGANRVTKHLEGAGIRAEAIHGNKSQNARERALEGFREGHVRVLVATDIAARGLDIKGISHVVNYDLPVDAESYVHRIGRTARAGTSGIAISLCSHEERPLLVRIERLIGRRVPVAAERKPSERRLVSEDRARDERAPVDDRRTRDERPARDARPANRDARPSTRTSSNARPSTNDRSSSNDRPARDGQRVRDNRPLESRPLVSERTRESRPASDDRRTRDDRPVRDERPVRDSRDSRPIVSDVRARESRTGSDERRSRDDRPLKDDRFIRSDERRDAPRTRSSQDGARPQAAERPKSQQEAPRGQSSEARRPLKPRAAY